MTVAAGASRGRLTGVKYDTTIDRKGLAHRLVAMLAQAVLERALHALVHILGDEAAAVGDNIAITTRSIAKVFQSSGIFATDESFELSVHTCVKAITRRLRLVAGLNIHFGRILAA